MSPDGTRPPADRAPGTAQNSGADARRLAAVREHALEALSELSNELTLATDVFQLADVALLNLMGQMGTSRAALWVVDGETGSAPVLVRSHGIGRSAARAIGSVLTAHLLEHFAADPEPMHAEGLDRLPGASAAALVGQTEIALFAPVPGRGRLAGLLALGPRIGGGGYGPVELRSLRAALAMVGVAIQNLGYYASLREGNRQLRLANEHLTELDRLKQQFLQNINHELRTPLTCVIAYLDVLGQMDCEPKFRRFLDVASEEAAKLQGLIENLLAFSALSRDAAALEADAGTIAPTLTRYCADRAPGIAQGLREFTHEWDPDLPAVQFNERGVCQILDVLIDNAVKFTPAGARIQLKAGVMNEPEAGWVRVSVADDGPGIAEDVLPTLFDTFRQQDGSTTRVVGGMGMGLALARQLASAMGARLSASSVIGRGSVFALDLPVATTRAGTSESPTLARAA